MVLAGCGTSRSGSHTTSSANPTSTTSSTTSVSTSTTASTVRTTLPTTNPPTTTGSEIPPGWTEAELLAQLIMVGGSYSDPGASEQAVQDGVGGVVFLGQPPAGSGPALTSQIGALLGAARIVPLMATDEEGGQIERLSNIVGSLPWPRQMAEQWSPAEVTVELTSVAQKMKALGMNMDLAPVLDTASSADTIDEENLRSFSEVGATAGAYGLAFMKGLAAGGMIGVVKHFPGLGHANGNTDAGPASDPPISELERDDLIPFQQAIAARAPVVMMSNVTEPDWGTAPASLNSAAYAFLRNMGFTGMILTDSLDAGAISAIGVDGARGVVEAIQAGADMAMVTTPSDFQGALSGLEAAVSTGRLAISQVIRSVDRIITVKNSILPAADAITPPK